jgi:hypothetical protein
MSTERAPAVGARAVEGHGLRLMIAIVVSTLFGVIYGDYLVTFTAPVFVTMFCAPEAPAPALGRAVGVSVMIWAISTVTGSVAAFFANHQDILVLVFAAVIFLCFLRDAKVGPTPTIGLVLVVLVLVGTMSASAAPLANQVIAAMPVAVLGAMFSIMFAHAIVPSVGDASAAGPQAFVPPRRPVADAIARTVILMPLVIGYLVASKVGGFYVLIAAVAVLRVPRPEHAGLGMVAANVLGGAAALVAAMLIMVTPSPLFGIVILAILALGLGLMAERGGPGGALANAAGGPAIIILMLALAPLDSTELYISRVVEIAATVVYVLLVQALLGTVARAPAGNEAAGGG